VGQGLHPKNTLCASLPLLLALGPCLAVQNRSGYDFGPPVKETCLTGAVSPCRTRWPPHTTMSTPSPWSMVLFQIHQGLKLPSSSPKALCLPPSLYLFSLLIFLSGRAILSLLSDHTSIWFLPKDTFRYPSNPIPRRHHFRFFLQVSTLTSSLHILSIPYYGASAPTIISS